MCCIKLYCIVSFFFSRNLLCFFKGPPSQKQPPRIQPPNHQADDIASISEDLCLLNHYSSNTSSLIGRWLYANVHKLNTAQMTKVLGLFNHFNFADSNFMKALEKFVVAFAKRTVRGGGRCFRCCFVWKCIFIVLYCFFIILFLLYCIQLFFVILYSIIFRYIVLNE